jgi:hypothetical protein
MVSPTASTRQKSQPIISVFDNPSNMDNSMAVAMELCEGLGARTGSELQRVVGFELLGLVPVDRTYPRRKFVS